MGGYRSRGSLKAFALAAFALASGAILISLLATGSTADREPTSAHQRPLDESPPSDGPHSPLSATARHFAAEIQRRSDNQMRREENASYHAADSADAARAAKSFTEAFLLYEVGRLGKAGRTSLANTATPSLAKALLGNPVRLPGGVRPRAAHLRKVGAVRPASSAARLGFSVIVLVERNHVPQVLGLQVVEGNRGWVVSEVGR